MTTQIFTHLDGMFVCVCLGKKQHIQCGYGWLLQVHSHLTAHYIAYINIYWNKDRRTNLHEHTYRLGKRKRMKDRVDTGVSEVRKRKKERKERSVSEQERAKLRTMNREGGGGGRGKKGEASKKKEKISEPRWAIHSNGGTSQLPIVFLFAPLPASTTTINSPTPSSHSLTYSQSLSLPLSPWLSEVVLNRINFPGC